MSKWLRKDKARENPHYQAILEKASADLEESGFFHKDEVLGALGYEPFASDMRWDYIRVFLEEEQGCELMPLAESFFKAQRKAGGLDQLKPERYLASGHGKKTAGYAAVTEENDFLVIKRVAQRKAMANGVGRTYQDFLQAVVAKRGAPIPFAGAEQKKLKAVD